VSGVTKKPLPRPDAVSMSTTAAIALLTTSSSEDGAATEAGAAIVAAGGTGMGSAMGVAAEDGAGESGFAGAFATTAVCGGPTALAGFMKNHTAPPPATAAAITRIPHGAADDRASATLSGTESSAAAGDDPNVWPQRHRSICRGTFRSHAGQVRAVSGSFSRCGPIRHRSPASPTTVARASVETKRSTYRL